MNTPATLNYASHQYQVIPIEDKWGFTYNLFGNNGLTERARPNNARGWKTSNQRFNTSFHAGMAAAGFVRGAEAMYILTHNQPSTEEYHYCEATTDLPRPISGAVEEAP